MDFLDACRACRLCKVLLAEAADHVGAASGANAGREAPADLARTRALVAGLRAASARAAALEEAIYLGIPAPDTPAGAAALANAAAVAQVMATNVDAVAATYADADASTVVAGMAAGPALLAAVRDAIAGDALTYA